MSGIATGARSAGAGHKGEIVSLAAEVGMNDCPHEIGSVGFGHGFEVANLIDLSAAAPGNSETTADLKVR